MDPDPPHRPTRVPLPQEDFDRKTLVIRATPPATWRNLRWRSSASDKRLYFASASGRLTPSSGKAPCIYLAPSDRTSFFEIYGDKMHLAHEASELPVIGAADFVERVFLGVDMPTLNLVDITSGPGLEAIDLDLGTLYATNPVYPRAFAEAVLRHPSKVDGFLYESRHTKETCAVVWSFHRPALAKVQWRVDRTLGDSATNLSGDQADVFGVRVQIAG